MYNWEKFQTAYKNASDEVRSVIDSDVIPKKVDVLIASGLIEDSLRRQSTQLLSLLVLGVLTDKDFGDKLRELGVTEVDRVAGEVRDILPNSEPKPTATTETSEKEQSTQKPEPVDTPLPEEKTQIAQPYGVTPVAPTPKPTTPTTEELTHTSSQDDILLKPKTDPDEVRWGNVT